MLYRYKLFVPVIQNNIHIIRMFPKRSIPGIIQHEESPRDFGIYSAK